MNYPSYLFLSAKLHFQSIHINNFDFNFTRNSSQIESCFFLQVITSLFSQKVFQSYKEISAEVAHTVHCFLLLFSGAAPFHTRKEASTVGCNQCCQLCLFHLPPENDLMEFQKTFERINFAGRKYTVFFPQIFNVSRLCGFAAYFILTLK